MSEPEHQLRLQALRERRIKAVKGERKRMTKYLVLKSWDVAGEAEAVNGAAAIKAVLSDPKHSEDLNSGGTFVAVPARSWQPVPVKAETTLKFG